VAAPIDMSGSLPVLLLAALAHTFVVDFARDVCSKTRYHTLPSLRSIAPVHSESTEPWGRTLLGLVGTSYHAFGLTPIASDGHHLTRGRQLSRPRLFFTPLPSYSVVNMSRSVIVAGEELHLTLAQ